MNATQDRPCQECGQVHEWCSGHAKHSDPKRPCNARPKAGHKACRRHGGNTPQAAAKAERVLAAQAAEVEVARLGLDRRVPPGQALLEEVWRTAGRVAWLERKVAENGEDGLFVSTAFGPQQNAWDTLLTQERRHLVVASSAAIKGGAIEAQVEIARSLGERVGAWLDAVTADLGLTQEQRARAWEAGERHLHLVVGAAG